MVNSEIGLSQSAVGLIVPPEVLAGGFIVIDGHIVPITNGVMGPAREILKALGAMFAANTLASGDTRNQALGNLADQVAVSAADLKSSVAAGTQG